MKIFTLNFRTEKKISGNSLTKIFATGLLAFFLMFVGGKSWGQTTYTWNSSTAVWTTSTAWTPTRTTPATNDILVFSSGTTVTPTTIPTETIGQLSVSGSTTVNLQAAADANVLTIGGGTSTDLSVASGSQLNINGANALFIELSTGATGSITGNMTFSGATHRLDAANASSITFNSPSVFTQGTGCTGSVFFTSGTANAIIFATGTTFLQIGGANPFGLMQPSSRVVFQAGSLYKHQNTTAPALSGRTYANFEYNIASSLTGTGSSAFVCDNLTVSLGTFNCNVTGTPGHSIKGNISVASGATLTFTPASAGTMNFNGTTAQSISNAGTLSFAANETVVVNNASGVSINNNITLNGPLTLTSGTLSIGSNTLTLNGTVVNTSGTLTGSSTSNLTIGGTGALGTLNFNQTTDGTTNILNAMTVNRTSTGTLSLGNKLVIIDSYTPTAGVLSTGGFLNLRSTATKTARIASNSTGSDYITGDVAVERYIPAKRAWKLLTAPVRNAGSIGTNWQNGGTANGSTGVNIWGPTGGTPPTVINGLYYGAGYSMKQYDVANNAWAPITNTTTAFSLSSNSGSNNGGAAANKSFLLFVTNPFDAAGTNITPSGSAVTTLRATGSLQQGDQTFLIAAHHPTTNQYALVGNPYASPVNFSDLMLLGTNLSTIENRFWLFDATQPTLGNYQVVYYVSAGNYFIVPGTTPSGGASAGDYIHLQSGQAVFVEPTATGGTLTFKEAYKSVPPTAPPIFLVPPQSLAVNLNMGSQLLDGSLMLYDNNYAAAIVAAEDVKKIYNDGANVAIARNNEGYIIEARPEITSKDTSFLWISNIQANQTYRFSFKADQFNPLISAWLEDAFTNGRTAVNLSGTLNYIDFSTTSDPASRHYARFRIVYEAAGPLPISFTDVKAYQQSQPNGQATAVKVAWTVSGELNADRYEVEYSTDGVHFSQLANVAATGNNNGTVSYSYLHGTPATGMNYYRIKLIERSGSSKYSIIVKVDLGIKGAPGIVIYPNPVINKQSALQLYNLPAGNYEIVIFSNTGQLVSRATISHSGGTSSRQLPIEVVTASGVYMVQVTGPDKNRYNTTITIKGQ